LIWLGFLTYTTTSTPTEPELEPRDSFPRKYKPWEKWEKYNKKFFSHKKPDKHKYSGYKNPYSGNQNPSSGYKNPSSGNQNPSSKGGKPSSSPNSNQSNNKSSNSPNPPKNQPSSNSNNKPTGTCTSAGKSNPTATYATSATGTSTSTSAPTNLPPLNLSKADSPDIFEPFGPLDFSKGPQTREYSFTLKRTTLNPDGYSRVVWAVNGK
ncbi:9762_t:CDS:1, partial [Dentiscutata heterogama]